MATYGDDVRVQILVKRDTPEGRFHDAIYVSKDEFDAMTDAQVEQLKDARAAAWSASVTEARTKPPVQPTKAQLQEMKLALEAQVAEIDANLAEAEGAVEGEK